MEGDLKYCKPSSWKAGQKEACQQFVDSINNPIKIGKAIYYEFHTAQALELLRKECQWHLEFETSGANGFLSSGDVNKSLRAAARQIKQQVK
jgi:hypothetical protein